MHPEKKFMRRCFEIARKSAGQVSPNPMVGCVITYKNQIIGEGFHQQYGQGHAEVKAVQSVSKENLSLLQHSTLYVSLEPCFHIGNTPPCVDLVLKHKIPRVVISCLDPNPKVSGQSVSKLKEAGIEVHTGFLEKEGMELAKIFFHDFINKRPYVVLKWAESQFGYMGKPDKQIWLSNPLSGFYSHRLRAHIDSILVGPNTLKLDKPALSNRSWMGSHPVRVAWDFHGDLDQNQAFFDGQVKTILFTAFPDRYSDSVLLESIDPNRPDWIGYIFETLYSKHRIQSILVEGGAHTIKACIENDLWQEAHIFKTQNSLKEGIPAPILSKPINQNFPLQDNHIMIYQNA